MIGVTYEACSMSNKKKIKLLLLVDSHEKNLTSSLFGDEASLWVSGPRGTISHSAVSVTHVDCHWHFKSEGDKDLINRACSGF